MDQNATNHEPEALRVIRVDLPDGRVAMVAVSTWPASRPDQVAAPSDADLSMAGDQIKKLNFAEL